MGIFDWMDFNGDGKVDDFEQVLGFSMLEDDDLLSSGKHTGPFGSDADEDDDADEDTDEDGTDAWDDDDAGADDGDWF